MRALPRDNNTDHVTGGGVDRLSSLCMADAQEGDQDQDGEGPQHPGDAGGLRSSLCCLLEVKLFCTLCAFSCVGVHYTGGYYYINMFMTGPSSWRTKRRSKINMWNRG